MKPSQREIKDLRRRLSSFRKRKPLTNAEIGRLADVHPSQVGRICAGEFRTISNNVVQVCRVLGLSLETVAKSATKHDASWSLLEASVRELWDDSPEGADKIARMLTTIAEFRSTDT